MQLLLPSETLSHCNVIGPLSLSISKVVKSVTDQSWLLCGSVCVPVLHLPFSSPEALPVGEQHSGCGCVWTWRRDSLSRDAIARRTSDTCTLKEEEETDKGLSCVDIRFFLTLASRCVCQLCSAGGGPQHQGNALICLQLAVIFNVICLTTIIIIIAKPFLFNSITSSFPVLRSDNSGSVAFYVMQDCSSVEDAEVVCCRPVAQLPSILNKSSHISRTGVPVPVNDSHKSKSIHYIFVERWEPELARAASWFIHTHLLKMEN